MGIPKRKLLFWSVVGLCLIVVWFPLPWLGRIGAGAARDFAERSTDYVVAFADAAAAWLESGDREMLELAVKTMLLGSALQVSVVKEGKTVIEESLLRDLLPLPEDIPRDTVASFRRWAGHYLLEVLSPLGDRGYVQVCLDASFLIAAGRARLALGAGIALAVDILILGLIFVFRTRAGEREVPQRREGILEVGGLVVDELQKQVSLLGRPVRLSPKQFELLSLLASQPGKVFSDREILGRLWSSSRYANSKDVKQYIYLLRRRLGEAVPGGERIIVTVPGFGYKLVSPDEVGLTSR